MASSIPLYAANNSRNRNGNTPQIERQIDDVAEACKNSFLLFLKSFAISPDDPLSNYQTNNPLEDAYYIQKFKTMQLNDTTTLFVDIKHVELFDEPLSIL